MNIKNITVQNILSVYTTSMEVEINGFVKTFIIEVTQRGLTKLSFGDIEIKSWTGDLVGMPNNWMKLLIDQILVQMDLQYTLAMRAIHTKEVQKLIDWELQNLSDSVDGIIKRKMDEGEKDPDQDVFNDAFEFPPNLDEYVEGESEGDEFVDEDGEDWKNNRINSKYEEINRPSNFVQNFNSLAEFRKWCRSGTVLDLDQTLVAFEKDEEYIHCAVIRDVIQEKINE